MSTREAIADFIGFMQASGVDPDEAIGVRLASGSLIGFRCKDDNKDGKTPARRTHSATTG